MKSTFILPPEEMVHPLEECFLFLYLELKYENVELIIHQYWYWLNQSYIKNCAVVNDSQNSRILGKQPSVTFCVKLNFTSLLIVMV